MIKLGKYVIDLVMQTYCMVWKRLGLSKEVSNDAKCHREIRRRIAMGKEAFLKRKELLTEKKPQEKND